MFIYSATLDSVTENVQIYGFFCIVKPEIYAKEPLNQDKQRRQLRWLTTVYRSSINDASYPRKKRKQLQNLNPVNPKCIRSFIRPSFAGTGDLDGSSRQNCGEKRRFWKKIELFFKPLKFQKDFKLGPIKCYQKVDKQLPQEF